MHYVFPTRGATYDISIQTVRFMIVWETTGSWFLFQQIVILGGNSAKRMECVCCVLVASTETRLNSSTAKCVLAI